MFRDLDRHQVLNTVLGQFQDVVLTGVVLGMGALVGGSIGILHRELTTTIANAEHRTTAFLESFWGFLCTLSLPYIEL